MFRDQEWLLPSIILASLATIVATTLRIVTDYPGQPSGKTSLVAAVAIGLVVALFRFLRHLWILWREGESHPIARIRGDLPLAFFTMAPITAGIAIMAMFLYSATFLKSMIPAVVPFWADPLLAATDKAIFVNGQSLALAVGPLLPVLGYFYAGWHAAHIGGILWVLHWETGNKSRHIISFMLVWFIGMVFAYLFSSMGPIFTGRFDATVAPPTVRKTAEFLWANYQSGGALIGGGISAFPSIHVAIATWFALVLRDRGLSLMGAIYLIGVFVCSVILGWHYVIDGAAGVAIAFFANRLSETWLQFTRSRSLIRGQTEAVSN